MNREAAELIDEAKELLDAAEEKQRVADEDKWAAAERMWRANREYGVPKKEIARLLGRSPKMVRNHIAVWERAGGDARPPSTSFTDVYYEVRGPEGSRQGIADREVRKAARERPEAIAKAISEAPAEAQRKIADEILASQKAERSVKSIARSTVEPPSRPPLPKAEDKLHSAVFIAWEASELLMDEAPSADERYRMQQSAERLSKLATGIQRLLATGELDDAFRQMVEEGIEA